MAKKHLEGGQIADYMVKEEWTRGVKVYIIGRKKPRKKPGKWSWEEPPQKCGNPQCLAQTMTESDNCPRCLHLYDYEVGGNGCHCHDCVVAREKKEDPP